MEDNTNFINNIKTIFQDKYAQILIALFSIIFGLVKSLAEFIYNKDTINVDILRAGIYAIICYLSLNLFYYIITLDYKTKQSKLKSPRKLWWTFFIIFITSYGICWLTYWPGTIYIDNWWIALSGTDLYIAGQHPITYCAFISPTTKIGLWLGSISYSIAIYTGLQILITSLFMTFLFHFIFQRKIPQTLKIILLLSCIFLPIYALFSISNTKDIYWSICVAGFTISLYQLYTSQKQDKKFWLLFNIYVLGIILLRNNGIYIILPTLAYLLWLFPIERKQLAISLCLTFLAVFLVSVWMKSLNIRPLFQEKVGVPIQQIAAVVKRNGNITAEQKDFISKIIPINVIKKSYNPYHVDALKWESKEFNATFLNDNTIKFLIIWKDIIRTNFKLCLLAYLQAVYWYWAPNENGKLDLILETLPDKDRDFLIPWILKNGYVKHEILPTNIKHFLIKYYEKSYNFWHEGSLFWILTGCALLYFLKQRNLKSLIIYFPIFLLWITLVIAGTLHSFRYVLSYIYILPFFIALLFTKTEKIAEQK